MPGRGAFNHFSLLRSVSLERNDPDLSCLRSVLAVKLSGPELSVHNGGTDCWSSLCHLSNLIAIAPSARPGLPKPARRAALNSIPERGRMGHDLS